MSRSNPTAKNPATRFMQWRGGEDGGGRITWYDKEAEEEKEVDLPFTFLVLDEFHTITGFSEKDHSGFWSNEVRDLKDELVVKTKSGTIARGKYDDIKDKIKALGAKYTKSVYIAFKDETGEFVIGNIKIGGAALTAWIEFQGKFDVNQVAVMVTEKPKKAKKGSTTYFVPVFEARNVSDATNNAAIALDKELQQYIGTYLSRKPEEDDLEEVDDDVEIEDTDEPVEIPPAQEAKPVKTKKAAPKEEPEEDTIDLKDVPF